VNLPKEKKLECKKHGVTMFVLREKTRYRCRKCSVEAVAKRRKKIVEQAIKYKGGKCEKCGYNRCNSALEFHHINPNEKDFAIGEKGHSRSWERVQKEIDKCIMVCANCHREIHEELRN
jgi:hypothetical protein